MKNSSRFFANTACEYYPCHLGMEEMNCLFCYCPLYKLERCPGKCKYADVNGKKLKICTDCTFPHQPENYDVIIRLLEQRNAEEEV